jgi:hypothetical protein
MYVCKWKTTIETLQTDWSDVQNGTSNAFHLII